MLLTFFSSAKARLMVLSLLVYSLTRNIEIFEEMPYNFENKPRGLYFSKALFEGLIFGGAYLPREICVSNSIGLAL